MVSIPVPFQSKDPCITAGSLVPTQLVTSELCSAWDEARWPKFKQSSQSQGDFFWQFLNLSLSLYIYIQYIDGVSWNMDTVIWKTYTFLFFLASHLSKDAVFFGKPPSSGDLRVANRNQTHNLRREHAFPAVALIGLTATRSRKNCESLWILMVPSPRSCCTLSRPVGFPWVLDTRRHRRWQPQRAGKPGCLEDHPRTRIRG